MADIKPGPEVTGEAVRVLETVIKHTDLDIKLESKDFGGAAIDSTGDPLPDDTLKSCQEADAILLGGSLLLTCKETECACLTGRQVLLEDQNGVLGPCDRNRVSCDSAKRSTSMPTSVLPTLRPRHCCSTRR